MHHSSTMTTTTTLLGFLRPRKTLFPCPFVFVLCPCPLLFRSPKDYPAAERSENIPRGLPLAKKKHACVAPARKRFTSHWLVRRAALHHASRPLQTAEEDRHRDFCGGCTFSCGLGTHFVVYIHAAHSRCAIWNVGLEAPWVWMCMSSYCEGLCVVSRHAPALNSVATRRKCA